MDNGAVRCGQSNRIIRRRRNKSPVFTVPAARRRFGSAMARRCKINTIVRATSSPAFISTSCSPAKPISPRVIGRILRARQNGAAITGQIWKPESGNAANGIARGYTGARCAGSHCATRFAWRDCCAMPVPPRWESTVAEIARTLPNDGWSEEKGAFVRACNEPSIYDISVLALVLEDLIAPDDPHLQRTVDTLAQAMAFGPAFRRDEEDVRYPFYLATLWMVRALTTCRRVRSCVRASARGDRRRKRARFDGGILRSDHESPVRQFPTSVQSRGIDSRGLRDVVAFRRRTLDDLSRRFRRRGYPPEPSSAFQTFRCKARARRLHSLSKKTKCDVKRGTRKEYKSLSRRDLLEDNGATKDLPGFTAIWQVFAFIRTFVACTVRSPRSIR